MAINPWQPHAFQPCSNEAFGLPGRLYLRTLARPSTRTAPQASLRLKQHPGRHDDSVRSASSLAHALVTNASYRIVNRYLNQLLTRASMNPGPKRSAGRSVPAAAARRSISGYANRCASSTTASPGHRTRHVARDAGLSRPHFFKLFRENTGVTPALYANTMRVERALDRLMARRSRSPTSASNSAFPRKAILPISSRPHVGIAPTQYRTIARVVSE